MLVADVPWAYLGSGFTKDFVLTVGWLAVYLPRSTVSEYMRIDWETVGRCVHRTLNVIEPARFKRLDNLVNIGIDETSYRKGHKYHGHRQPRYKYGHLSGPGTWQDSSETVPSSVESGTTFQQKGRHRNGARWITDCVNEFTPSCERYVDPFHVVEWAMQALDEVRRDIWREAHAEAVKVVKDHPRGKERV